MSYVIRSMSTTDFNGRDPVERYHIYLLQPQHRRGAYWSTSGYIMVFPTLEEAEAEWLRIWPEGKRLGCTDIAPLRHPIPVWEEIHYQPEARG